MQIFQSVTFSDMFVDRRRRSTCIFLHVRSIPKQRAPSILGFFDVREVTSVVMFFFFSGLCPCEMRASGTHGCDCAFLNHSCATSHIFQAKSRSKVQVFPCTPSPHRLNKKFAAIEPYPDLCSLVSLVCVEASHQEKRSSVLHAAWLSPCLEDWKISPSP